MHNRRVAGVEGRCTSALSAAAAFFMNESRHVSNNRDERFLVAYDGYPMSPNKRSRKVFCLRASHTATQSIVCNRSNGTNTRLIAHIDNFYFSSIMCRLLSFYFKWKRSQTHEKRREKKKTCRKKRRKMLSVLHGRPSRDDRETERRSASRFAASTINTRSRRSQFIS